MSKAPFTLNPQGPMGWCRFCGTPNLYSKIRCDECGYRLPWADGIADSLGEKCPKCGVSNTYIRTNCCQCGEALPWSECIAAQYHRTHDVEREFKMTMIYMLVAGIIFILGFALVRLKSDRSHVVL